MALGEYKGSAWRDMILAAEAWDKAAEAWDKAAEAWDKENLG